MVSPVKRAKRSDPSPRLIEECARFLRVRPEYFREYRGLALSRAA
jgi:hypothetical protein